MFQLPANGTGICTFSKCKAAGSERSSWRCPYSNKSMPATTTIIRLKDWKESPRSRIIFHWFWTKMLTSLISFLQDCLNRSHVYLSGERRMIQSHRKPTFRLCDVTVLWRYSCRSYSRCLWFRLFWVRQVLRQVIFRWNIATTRSIYTKDTILLSLFGFLLCQSVGFSLSFLIKKQMIDWIFPANLLCRWAVLYRMFYLSVL